MRLHAIVADLDVARTAIEGGATVVQLRLKGIGTHEVVERGRPLRELCRDAGVTFVVNDDVDAAGELAADGVHLGRHDSGAERAAASGLLLGLSASTPAEASAAEQRRAAYIGAGPVWTTPSKTDADPPIGLAGLAAIARAVAIPVIAIGGVDATNVRDCVRAGAAGVAVIRAAAEAALIRPVLDEALAAR